MTHSARPAPADLATLSQARESIDAIDVELMTLLAERHAIVDRVVTLKQAEGVAAAAPSRAKAVISGARTRAEEMGFDPDLAETIWREMVAYFIAREERVLGKEGVDK